ncbi:histidine phosphatase family protein [Streptomyces polyrhachis]|uniref:Histidine phosphatase family protein n=1 Tax=Streptomyces polyrhachis TaxID=1282885 RepID=A0ABW2GJL9_9ACTN
MTLTAAAAEITAGTTASPPKALATRHLYLARHAEALPDESGLSERGRRQARLLGERLGATALDAVYHGPLARAAQTARLAADGLRTERGEGDADGPSGPPVRSLDAAGDYVPYFPARDELPAKSAAAFLPFLADASDEDREQGPRLAREALRRFSGPVAGERERHELVITHNFLIGWLVRAAMGARPWRWLGLNSPNAALTVIRYAPGRPAALLLLNDMSHLPEELRWTGMPAGAKA